MEEEYVEVVCPRMRGKIYNSFDLSAVQYTYNTIPELYFVGILKSWTTV
jgi:hypothetical protein